MVSASKLRRAQEAISSQRPYARQIDSLIRRVSSLGLEDAREISRLVRPAIPVLAEGQRRGSPSFCLWLLALTAVYAADLIRILLGPLSAGLRQTPRIMLASSSPSTARRF